MTKIDLKDAKLIEDKDGRLWLPTSQIINNGVWNAKDAQIIQIGDDFYEVVGYSFKRRSYWIEPVPIEGAAANIEEQVYSDEL